MRKKTLIQIAVFAFCIVSMNTCGLFTPKEFFPERILWYEEPADFFEEALPDSWSTGRICGLRARGGFTVNQEWKNGKLSKATIYPDFSGEVKIRYRDETKTLELKAGRTTKIRF